MQDAPTSTAEAHRFLEKAVEELSTLSIESQQADWVYNTYITLDSEALAAKSQSRVIQKTVEFAKQSMRLSRQALPASVVRQLELLRLSLPLITPSDPHEADELTRTVAAMTGHYGRATFRPKGADGPLDIQGLSRLLGASREPAALQDAWEGWHATATPIRAQFGRYVELANRGSRELGFADTGAMWRSKYEMPPDSFAREVDRLWEQVQPLYRKLHAYVRRRLLEHYGPEVVPERGPIPAHLLGNMWAQSWEYTFPLIAPRDHDPGVDLTEALRARGVDALGMVKFGERFFSSLQFEPLPPSFWERSMFHKPKDREVVCHASAWDLDFLDDLRIKMCIEITGEDFRTIHHELGHNYYQRAYKAQPFLFRDGAHDGFHEAIGDAIALSVTPEYLQRAGLIDSVPGPEKDVGLLLQAALEKVAFLPFGLLIDQWRWKVFAGEITPAEYNRTWWELKRKYQGVAPPGPRTEEQFDPGAKFHVAANVPYMRYFLAHILQFQFHRAMARAIGWNGPLHRCSIYGEPEAGRRLRAMLEVGQSQPWPEALALATDERTMDARAVLDYFAPLSAWLDRETASTHVGW